MPDTTPPIDLAMSVHPGTPPTAEKRSKTPAYKRKQKPPTSPQPPPTPAPYALSQDQLFASADLMTLAEAVDDNAVDADRPDSPITTIGFALGQQEDREVVATSEKVTITSLSDANKKVEFTVNRWAHFVAVLAAVDEEAKELNRKTRPVAYRQHIGDAYYVSVTGGIMCVDIRKFYVPYGLTSGEVRPSKSGIALRIDEWVSLLEVIPHIHKVFPQLADAKRCVDDSSHMGQRGWMECSSCHPFGQDIHII